MTQEAQAGLMPTRDEMLAMAESLTAWGPLVASGYEVAAAGQPMLEAAAMLRAIARAPSREAELREALKEAVAKGDAEMERVKACDMIADGVEGWEALRNLCVSTMSVSALRDRFAALEIAASNLIKDVRRRYPGEDLKCPYMIALDDALSGSAPVQPAGGPWDINWTVWNGGVEWPFWITPGLRMTVQRRDGSRSTGTPADFPTMWRHNGNDVVAYRLDGAGER